METLQVLMPMGGLGSRFSKAGYTTPKALIDVNGKPMFMRALESFSSVAKAQYIFVIRTEHDKQYDLSNQIAKQIPSAKIALLDHDTKGAVETCMIANELINDQLPITIADCDIYFESAEYFSKIVTNHTSDAMLLTFESNDSRYSYVKLDDNGEVIRTAEKIVISRNAILGGYFFRNGDAFKRIAKEFVSSPLPDGLSEYYMSHLFNILLEKHSKVETARVDVMHIFGTPEELNRYLNSANS